MPKQKGRGKIVRHVTKKIDGKYMRCDVYEKSGPRGGKTVCSKPKTPKGKK